MLCYCVDYRTAIRTERVLCSAAQDAYLTASQRLADGATVVRMTCDGVAIELEQLAEMAAAELNGCVAPFLVWSG